jgi:(p)ppGpp synthase/HD superfamily hydrolase
VIAARAHAGQTDKYGEIYLLHPLRVALDVPTEARVVAVLHDVLEDTDLTEDDLREASISPVELEALRLVTRDPNESYEEFIERIALAEGEAGRLARLVKKADVRDNLGRMTPEIRSKEPDRELRYKKALARLEEVEEHS